MEAIKGWLKELAQTHLGSRKTRLVIAGVVSTYIGKWINVPTEVIYTIIGLLAVNILGIAIEDYGSNVSAAKSVNVVDLTPSKN